MQSVSAIAYRGYRVRDQDKEYNNLIITSHGYNRMKVIDLFDCLKAIN